MASFPRAGACVAGLTLIVGCTQPASQALPAHPQPSRSAPASASASPTTSPSVSPSTPAPALPAAGGLVAESVQGSTALAVVTHRRAAGPGQGVVTVVVFDQARTRLVLHAGTAEPVAGRTWVHGPVLTGQDRARTIAVLNGGFKMRDARGGWMAGGRTVVPLVRGAASVVTYADGSTDIGAWGSEVPAPGKQVEAVRQNLTLLVDGGRPRLTSPSSQAQLNLWWGHAFANAALVSRSALGVTGDGRLVYAAGTRITVAALDAALLSAGVVRAMELDINAPLVRGFLLPGAAELRTPAGGYPGVLPLVVGQTQGPRYSTTSLRAPHCTYLVTCPRDFFAVEVR